MALHSVVSNGDTDPKLSVGHSTCFSRISFFPGCIHLIPFSWDFYSFCDSTATLKSFLNQQKIFISCQEFSLKCSLALTSYTEFLHPVLVSHENGLFIPPSVPG